MFKISPKFIQTPDMICQEASIATIANLWKNGYEMIYSNYWDFDVKPDITLCLGDRIKITHTKLNYELLKKYHNISINKYQYSDFNENIKEFYIQQLSSGHPIMTSYKEEYMPWDNRYSNIGYLLFYSYNKNLEEFDCIDVHNTKTSQILPTDNLIGGIPWNNNFYIASKIKAIEPIFNWEEIFHNTINKLLQKRELADNTFDCIRVFAHLFGEFKLSCENPKMNFINSSFYYNFKAICRTRNLYVEYLKYIGHKCNNQNIIYLAQLFSEAASQWSLAHSLLVKASLKDVLNKAVIMKVQNIIYNIAKMEQDLCILMSEICLNSSKILCNKASDYKDDRISNKRQIVLELKHYFNNKAFSDDLNLESNADFTGLQQYYLKNKLPIDNKLNIKDVIFSLEECRTSNYDNISCQSQMINLENGISNIVGVSFIYSCDWGSSDANINLIFLNNEIKKIHITFPHFFKYGEIIEHQIAWEGDCYDNKNKRLDEGKGLLFYKTYAIHSDSVLKKIELPYLPNSHVFAITIIQNCY